MFSWRVQVPSEKVLVYPYRLVPRLSYTSFHSKQLFQGETKIALRHPPFNQFFNGVQCFFNEVLEHFFVVIFALELFYRIYRVRWEYFRPSTQA